MASTFFNALRERIDAVDSLLCVGLDPHTTELPEPTAAAAEAFCVQIVQETQEIAAAYKPNAAFFEAFGADGFRALENVVKSIPAGIPVLLDAKRGDISTTAAAYAVSAFDQLRAHAITLAPYMGRDSIDPFIAGRPERGCFVLCKTSNPTSNDFQTLSVRSGSRTLYEEVAAKCHEWNTQDNIGLVVGATDVEALARVRAIAPDLWILAPGIGAQGGNLEEAVGAALSSDGKGLLVPVSRGVSKASDRKQAATELRDAINAVRKSKLSEAKTEVALLERQRDFIKFALSLNVLKFGDFTLKSGRQSPYFFNAGLFRTGKALGQLGRFYARAIHDSGIEFDVLFGPAYKGITLAAAVAIAYGDMYDVDLPFAYNRKEAKDHGEGGVLVGADMSKKRVLIIDDVITAGTAITEAMDILNKAGAEAAGVCISLDRQEKVSVDDYRSAIDRVRETYNMPVISIATLDSLVAFLEQTKDNHGGIALLDTIRQYRAEYGVSAEQ